MDVPVCGADRSATIDRTREDLLNRTSLTFLPRRQASFLEDYAHLPGGERVPTRDRIKLISDDYKRKFLRRVEIVVQHSRQAGLDQVSEFNWEADAWRDIFGRLRDDERLRMDKREYNYKATALQPLQTETNQSTYMGKRIPDITFGLSSYNSGDPEDEGVDERERRIRRSLQKNRLWHSTWTLGRYPLVADPKWGRYTLLFPFAVYEAKRDQTSEIEVRVQLKLAFNTYLSMLDRLVCQSERMEKCQSPRSRVFPIFGFTSSGSIWKMYVGYLPNCVKNDPDAANDPLCDDDSHMKLIWWGNTYSRQDAGELIDMVDQIHEYAVTTHRPFVARHLEVWERSIELHADQQEMPCPSKLPSSEQEVELDWYHIKSNGTEVQKLLRGKHKKGIPRTDDDVKRAALEARIKKIEKKRPKKIRESVRRRGRPRKVQPIQTAEIRDQAL